MADVRGTAVKSQLLTETAFKAPGANGTQLSVVTNTVVPSQARTESATLRGTRGQARSTEGNKQAQGQISVEMAPEDIGTLLKHLIGAPTTTGAGPYTHVFAPTNTGTGVLPPGFTLQMDYGTAIASASRFLQIKGCRVSRGTFTLQPQGAQTLQLDVMGSDWTKTNTDLDATPTLLGHTNFTATELTAVVGGGSPKNVCFSQLSIVVDNDLDGEKFCVGGGGVRDGLPEGFVKVTGSATMFFDHEDVLDMLLSGTDTELLVTLSRGNGLGSAGNESLTISLGDIVWDKTAPPIDGPRGLRVQANFMAHAIGSSEIDFNVTLKNAVATID